MGERFMPEPGEQVELVQEAEALAGERFMPPPEAHIEPSIVPQERQTNFIESEQRTIEAPAGMKENEIVFSDHVQNNPESEVEQFYGFNKLFKKTADVAALPFKGAAASAVSMTTSGIAGSKLKMADAIKQGFDEDVTALQQKAARGEKLTEEEARVVLREIDDFNNPLAWLMRSSEDKVRTKVKKAIRKGNVQAIDTFSKDEKDLRASVVKIRKNADDLIEKHFAKPAKVEGDKSNLAERVLYDFGGVTTSIGASIGLTVVTKNPVAAAVLFSQVQENSIYLEARDAGLEPETAGEKAALAGLVEGGLEFVGVSYFFKIAENSKGVQKHLFRMGEEAIQEFLQSGAESAITQSSGIREVDVMGALQEAGYSAFLGSLGGGATSVSMDVLAKRVEKQTGGAITADLAKVFLEKVEASSSVMENILAGEMETEISGVKGQADQASTEKALSYMEQFAAGKPIDISKLDRGTYEAIQEMRDANIEKVEQEIDAQESTGFLRVPARPQSISEFIKSKGGLGTDFADPSDLGTIDAFGAEQEGGVTENMQGEVKRFTKKESPTLKGVAHKKGTLTLDQALEAAIEAGYFPQPDPNNPTDISVNDLVDALESEAAGGDSFAEADVGAVVNRNAILDFNEQLDQAHEEILQNVREVKTFKAAFRKGVRTAKKDVKAAQEAAIKFVEENLPESADRAKFITAIKNIKDSKSLRKAAPDFERRIERILTDKVVKAQKARVKSLLSNKKLNKKPQAGKRVGRYDATTQKRLEYLQELYNVPGRAGKGEDQANKADEMLETFMAADVPDPLANAILQLKAAPQDVSAQFIERIADSIQAIQKFGLDEAEKRLHTRKQDAKDIRADIESVIDPAGDLLAQKRKAGVRKTVREGIAWGVEAWDDYIDRILPADLAHKLEVGEEISIQQGIEREMQDRLRDAAKEAFGKDKKALNRMLDESHVPHPMGEYTMLNGESEFIEISKAQARKLWMEYQNEGLREGTLQHADGNGYSDTLLKDIFNLLEPEDIAFAEAQLDIYEEFYTQINEVYERVFGISLPRSEFYSPIAREIDLQEANTDPFGREQQFRKMLAAGSALKLRDSAATAPLALQSDIAVFTRHVAEMSHFIAFREKTMLMNDVFGKAKLRKKIDAKFGKEYLKNLDQIRERIAGGGKNIATPLDKVVNYFNRGFATAVLGGKAKIGLTQLSSYFSYGEFVPAKNLVGGTRHFVANYQEAVKVMARSEFARNRGYNEDVDIQRMGKSFDNKTLRKIQEKKESIIDYTLIFTKLGDRGTIYMGGWSVYRTTAINQLTAEGMSENQANKTFDKNLKAGTSEKQGYHKKSIAAFERASRKTQQSKDVDQVSLMQSEKALGRTLSMFQSAPFAQFRGEVRAFRQFFFKKELTKAEFGKRFLIYHVLIPQFYRALSNGLLFGEFDEEDQLWTLALGSLNAIPIFSDLVNFGVRKAQGKPTHNGGLLKWSPVMYEIISDAASSMVNGSEGDFDLAAEYLADVGKGVGTLGGVMIPQIEQALEGMEDINFGDTKQGIMKIFGHPDSVAEGD